MLTELPPSREAVAGYAEGFAEGARQVPSELVCTQLRCGGGEIELRSVGRELHELIARPFPIENSSQRSQRPRPRLRIDVWDGRVWSGDPGLSRGREEPGVRYGPDGEELAPSRCRRYLRYTAPGFAFWLDRVQARIVGRINSPAALTWWNRSRPLQPLVGAWLLDHGALTVHAAMVSAGGRGVLLPGSTGSGKSTCAVAGLEAGLSVLGDDLASVVMTDHSVEGECVYTTVKLTGEAMLARPELGQLAEAYGEREWLIHAAELEPNPTVASSQLAAIAFPELSSRRSSRIVPLPGGRALLALLPCLQPVEPGHVKGGFALARELVQRLPAFRLEVGRSSAELARALRELCASDQ